MERSESTGGSGGAESDFPDNQQLFVGNLSHDFTDAELTDFFERYGQVEEMRIDRSGGDNVPTSGFIVFKCPETVQKILKAKGLLYNNRRLIVEEKKPRSSSPESTDSSEEEEEEKEEEEEVKE